MKKTKILYVEDEPFLAKIVKESLESKGFEVSHVADGAKVLTRLANYAADICLLDVMLPNIDGFAIAKAIKKRQDLPIIFLTAKEQTEDLVKGFESGGNDYIKKPFSMEELIIRIKNLLQLTQMKQAATPKKIEELVTFGSFQFHPLRLQLTHPNFSKRLSYREAEILKELCRNINSTTDRKELLLKIWGDDSFFNSRNLDVYIKKLRDYLKVDEEVSIITLKGVGYHFSVR